MLLYYTKTLVKKTLQTTGMGACLRITWRAILLTVILLQLAIRNNYL